MKNKILAVMCSVLILMTASSASAAVEYTDNFAREVVKGLDIIVGDSYGNMNLDSLLSRAEFAKIAVNASGYKNAVAHGAKISVFEDCTYTHWAAPYVKVAVTNRIITGYPDGAFRPDEPVALEEAVTVMLRLLGYTDEDFGNSWPYGQISLALNIGLTDNISKNIGEAVCREDALKLVYNTLNTKMKGGDKEYYNELDAQLYDNVILIATNKEDTSVSPGYILTSAGTFKLSDSNIADYIGLKGSLGVKSGGEVFCFSPYGRSVEEYVVYSVLSESLIVYHKGSLSELKLGSNTPVYSGAEQLSFSSVKSSVEIGDVIYAVSDTNGAVEYLTLTKDSMEGPYTLAYTANWYSKFTDDVSSLTVIRNGEKTTHDSLKTNDILYYSRELNTVFAYSKTVTGIYENALPNKDTPSSVVISGNEYQIESVEAFTKLSSAGNLSYGTSVTLLLGKDSKIADVITSSAISDYTQIVGYLIETGKKSFTEQNETYTSRYVSLMLTDGSVVEYKTEKDYSSLVNSVVVVTFSGEMAFLSKVSASGLSGTVSASDMKIGTTPVSQDIEILDVSTVRNDYKGSAVKTYIKRLDTVNLLASSVLWFSKNSTGEVNKLILKDVTGDSSIYGIITEAPEAGSAGNASYTIDSRGTLYRYSGGKFSNLTYISPVKAVVSGTEVQTMSALSRISGSVNDISGDSINVDSVRYLLSDDVIVYKQLALRNYAVIPLAELIEAYDNESGYTITAYCDKPQKNGGRVRIIMVQ